MPQHPYLNAKSPSGNLVPLAVDEDGALLTSKGANQYATVAASQTGQALGTAGAIGDIIDSITYVPATTAAGAVSIKDGSGSAITIFVGGGTTALTSLAPVTVPLGLTSVNGGWSVTTGANVSAIVAGNFTNS